MPDSRFAILDPSSGISGDMLLGALIDLGADEGWLQGLPARLGCPDVRVEIARVDRAGIEARHVTIRLPDGSVEAPATPVVHAHGHGAHSHHHGEAHGQVPHRHVGELLELIERAPLSGWVKDRALRAFRLLGEAEGRIHGVAATEVALHEVGALDALVDIVGGIEGFEQLGITRIYRRPVSVGEGWVRATHGVLSVPAPVTGLLLEGIEIGPNGPVTGEATTPTGAVLLRVLSEGPPPARWRPTASGWGAGGRNPAAYPNVLRVLIGEPAGEANEVVVTATDLDDFTPEYLEPVRVALFAEGALDVQVWSTMAKKGRASLRIEVLSEAAVAGAIAEVLFRHTTTGGVRRWVADRTTLPRREFAVTTRDGAAVRVKVLDAPGGARVKAEYDDVIVAAREAGRSAADVVREVEQQAVDRMAREVASPLTDN
ncbi:MAG: nickel pincer cofactor biosynthesis protein LarC [Gemmatimonadales bacterium]